MILPLAVAGVVAPMTPAGAATEVTRSDHFFEILTGEATRTDGCTRTTTRLDARPSRVELSTSVENTCTGSFSSSGGTAAPTVFEMTKDGAHVVATIAVQDGSTHLPTGEVVQVDSTWTATGQAPRVFSDPVRTGLPGVYKLSERTWTRTVPASVTGTIALDHGEMTTAGFRTMSVVHEQP